MQRADGDSEALGFDQIERIERALSVLSKRNYSDGVKSETMRRSGCYSCCGSGISDDIYERSPRCNLRDRTEEVEFDSLLPGSVVEFERANIMNLRRRHPERRTF